LRLVPVGKETSWVEGIDMTEDWIRIDDWIMD
jgi:hypothetical protein